MNHYQWADSFKAVYEQAVAGFQRGVRGADRLIPAKDKEFLQSIGCSPQELYDFVEDQCDMKEPSWETVLLISAVRREYFLEVQGRLPSQRVIAMDELPAKEARLGGLAWLPRIIAKAEAKLRGEMPPDLMYSCGGDRAFLKSVNMHPADFLRLVWEAAGDEEKILERVREHAAEETIAA